MLQTLAIKFVSNCFSEKALASECEECETKLDNWKLFLLVTLHIYMYVYIVESGTVVAAPKLSTGSRQRSKVHPGGPKQGPSSGQGWIGWLGGTVG